MPETNISEDKNIFARQLAGYKQLIDEDIAIYSQQQQKVVGDSFGDNARLEVDTYLAILGRGGKRIRGALAIVGYQMCGGKDMVAALQLARALEMLHAYILIIDDIQDQSDIRRGGPTAHVVLAEYHKAAGLKGNAAHFGMSIALNTALWGCHQAENVIASIDIDSETRLKLLTMANNTMATTAHGQTQDILNEVAVDLSSDDIERVLEWKTAQYTFINPLRMGMSLAGADEQTVAAISAYGTHAGKAFQITDDILGIFGTQADSGKSPTDDIRQGKHTVVIAYALKHANQADREFLNNMLGNNSLTNQDFERCKDIITNCGARDFAQKVARQHVTDAVESLDHSVHLLETSQHNFLRSLAQHLLTRTA